MRLYNVFGRLGQSWYLLGTYTDAVIAVARRMQNRESYHEVVICEGEAWTPEMELVK